MKPIMVIITHVQNRAVTEGFIPAALKLGYQVVLLTDHGLDHKHYFSLVCNGPDQIIECDVFNPLAIIDLLDGHNIKPQVVFSNSDHLQTSNALVADYFSCPGKNWKTCYQAKNKAQMRQTLTTLGIENVCSQTLFASDPLPENLTYPIIAKPREGVSSLDVALCENEAALIAYKDRFKKKSMPILLESYLEGPLFTLETLGDGENIAVIGGFDVQLSPLPHFIELSAIWNGENSALFAAQALQQVKAFGANFGVCHSEFIVTANGPVLVEINYRSIGDGREFLLNDLLTFNWFEKILQLHAGEILGVLNNDSECAVIEYFPAYQSGLLKKNQSAFTKQLGATNINYQPLKEKNQYITLSNSNKDYLGLLTATGPTLKEIKQKTASIINELIWEVN
ncbi:ATP-grasp domain-containing protein [Psychromonas sp. Urea-02u-13]|uniref:ATP-grasp domain-containing protein n=1 Tax=Psychromonas sp. Urea-02u-13 TaxID=2058326 RepID=UPI000C339497|nr:siderophore biosynthesis protein PvsA [Psychromonas sp. Urea-02u-13]PKG39078.1 siderophore biosynthesis protein PvsA [Psychromonas sp. Urea-02u-13]